MCGIKTGKCLPSRLPIACNEAKTVPRMDTGHSKASWTGVKNTVKLLNVPNSMNVVKNVAMTTTQP